MTHDRWFLDAVATPTWEVADGAVHAVRGRLRGLRAGQAPSASGWPRSTAERRGNLLRKELAWLRRGPPARTRKPKFRIDAANALIADEPPPRDDVELMRFATPRLGKDVVDLEDATVAAAATGVAARRRRRGGSAPGERVGIVGVNGAGKSTLLRAARRRPCRRRRGRRKAGMTVRHRLPHPGGRASSSGTALARHRGGRGRPRSVDSAAARRSRARQLLERLGFTGGRQRTRVGDLSGGERRRLQLLRLLMDEPNVLMLDEPTNDLDIDTLTSLEDLLDGWAGTLARRLARPLPPRAGRRPAGARCSATAGSATCPAASRSTSGCARPPCRPRSRLRPHRIRYVPPARAAGRGVRRQRRLRSARPARRWPGSSGSWPGLSAGGGCTTTMARSDRPPEACCAWTRSCGRSDDERDDARAGVAQAAETAG